MMGGDSGFSYCDNIVGSMVRLLRENIAQQYNVSIFC